MEYTNLNITRLPKRAVEITAEIPVVALEKAQQEVLAEYVRTAEIDGFRKGSAPESLIKSKIGEMKLLERAAEQSLQSAWQKIVADEKLSVIDEPAITITKIGVGSPLVFKITANLAPEVELADYKKIAGTIGEEKATEVTNKEIDEVILNLRREVAHAKLHENGNESHDHAPIEDKDLPEVDENFLKTVGGFKDAETLKEKIREGLAQEKAMKAKDKHRTDILEKIIAGSKIEMPDVIIEAELAKMLAQFKDDIARAGVSYEDYLKHINKTEEEIKKEWLSSAEKRAASQIILSRIARNENIAPKEEDIKREMDGILSRDEKLDRFRVRMFVDNFLTNELVLQFLETVK